MVTVSGYPAIVLDQKERPAEPPASGFTAVNGRSSRSPRDTAIPNGMADDKAQPPPKQPAGAAEHVKSPPSDPVEGDWSASKANGDRQHAAENGRGDVPSRSPERRKRPFSDLEDDSSAPSDDDDRTPSPAGPDQPSVAAPDQRAPRPLPTAGSADAAAPYAKSSRVDAQQQTISGDVQMVDALQREPPAASQADDAGRPPAEAAGSSEATVETTKAGVPIDKTVKRKRQFSNRTKTGCITCRRRKKKCDEGKPHCNNCIRGGFLCQGYTVRTHVAATKPVGYNIQPKDYLDHPTRYSIKERPALTREIYTTTTIRAPTEGARERPITVDDSDQKDSSWPRTWSAEQPPRTFTQEYQVAGDYARTVPLMEQQITPREFGARDGSSIQRPAPPQSHSPPVSSLNASQSAMTAQLALQHQPHQSSALPSQPMQPYNGLPSASSPSDPRQERDKMLKQEMYFDFSPLLRKERDECRAALWRFNNAANPSLGISPEERMRLFRAVLEPSLRPGASAASPPASPSGRLGDDVEVEAPFHCEYGYNITVHEKVVIGYNCTIIDPCQIVIGARSIIGPNVEMYGKKYNLDPRKRGGSKGPAEGLPIIIEADVWIGGGVKILPGSRIGKGSMIEPGSIVDGDIPSFKVAGGNPATPKRSLFADESYS